MAQPKEASTRRQLVTIRKFLKRVKISFKERYAPKEDTSYFTLEGPSELESFSLVHQPGCLTMYSVFGVKAPKKQHGELEHFATVFNRAVHDGTLVVMENGSLVHRLSVCYRKVENLGEKYIASMLATMIESMEIIDLPLIQIAKGLTAKAAIASTWDKVEQVSVK